MGRRLRRARRIAVGLVGALVLAAAAGAPVYVFPPVDPLPPRADAVLVLGPPTRARTELGRELIAEGVADTLLISVWPSAASAPPGTSAIVACDEPGMHVVCFSADPETTQGEARALARYARDNHWSSIVVITQTPHIVRARVILERCWGGHLAMISSGEPTAFGDWAYEYAYQTGAFAKVLVDQQC
ncbi:MULTISPECIES: YdcF family protein [unclassified Rathayibacter]|uniref:YdcF family protein n=1 Tax=unclassified Rathayibacter TaxID=2609250 RepID=UPI00188B44F9|nr:MULTISPECIES: ElyC/SanA/YdcF family protein [unclassified Rathayibacter]MBF4463267.1 YdcF family protein [Rathayibacter sp. VKM Ac-2879]MBF4504496.1 YdcF family protein [Rathayibacter sp. VKM Ac-2878]